MDAGLGLIVILALAGLACVPLGRSGRSIADRLAPHTPADRDTSRLG